MRIATGLLAFAAFPFAAQAQQVQPKKNTQRDATREAFSLRTAGSIPSGMPVELTTPDGKK
jgi:hypothetical protein